MELVPLLVGGGQEKRLHSGRQAVHTIAGFGVAAQLASQEMPTEVPRLIKLGDRLFAQLTDIPGLIPTGDRINRLPHHVSFCLEYADGEKFALESARRQPASSRISSSIGLG